MTKEERETIVGREDLEKILGTKKKSSKPRQKPKPKVVRGFLGGELHNIPKKWGQHSVETQNILRDYCKNRRMDDKAKKTQHQIEIEKLEKERKRLEFIRSQFEHAKKEDES